LESAAERRRALAHAEDADARASAVGVVRVARVVLDRQAQTIGAIGEADQGFGSRPVAAGVGE
jgi:hypothetical protein